MDFHFISFICLLGTILLFIAARRLNRLHNTWYTMPLIVVSAITIALLMVFRISFADYYRYNHWLTWLLGPTVVAFAIPLYENRSTVKKHFLSISVGVIVGIIVAMSSSYMLMKLWGFDDEVTKSFIFRSISTPFAMAAAQDIGGSENLAAIFVVFTGVMTNLMGVFWLNLIKIKSYMAQGAAMGAAGHGVGTAKAFELGEKQGMISSLVMMLSGVITMLIAPLCNFLF